MKWDLNDLIGADVNAPQKEKRAVDEFGESKVETDIVKCQSCGANMTFCPDKQVLKCEHCGSEIDFTKDQRVSEQDFNLRACSFDDWGTETVVMRCSNCGSKETVSKTDIAIICPFCGTGNVIAIDELPGIKPTAVFPFTVSKDNCLIGVKKWIRKKWYVPSDFKKNINFDHINGVYSPCWTFDSNTCSNYSGVLGRYVTRTVGSGKNRRTVTEVKYFSVSGVIDKFYDDIMIEASPQFDQKTLNKIRPFDRSCAAVYDKKFLSGFVANHYDKDIETSFVEAKKVMEDDIKNCIMQKHNASVVQHLNVNTYHGNITFKYLLLPIWVGNYLYKKKQYNYFMNGNNGKIIGKVPLSAAKIALVIAAGLSLLGGVGLAYYYTDGFGQGLDDNYPSSSLEYVSDKATEYEIDGYKLVYNK